MNRKMRRELERLSRRQVVATSAGNSGVMLHGGPMDGYYVTADAPALHPDWYTTWPESVAAKNRPGRYVKVGKREGIDSAEWKEGVE